MAKSGFDDNKLYNDELLKLDGLELEEFQKLKQIIGASNQQKKPETSISTTKASQRKNTRRKIKSRKEKPWRILVRGRKRKAKAAKRKEEKP